MADKKAESKIACASCGVAAVERICLVKGGKAAKGCPTVTKKQVLDAANREYENDPVREFARNASIQEAECYANRDQKPYIMQPTKTRIVEICEFARKMGYKKIGLAFCTGLMKEAVIVEEIIAGYGFEVSSVSCKAGQTPKETIGLSDEEKVRKGTDESMCNPIFQAKVLNNENVDFNVLLGLCVGHDTLFLQYSNIPVTVLAVKDRVTGHNPLAAIYNSESYYRKIRHPELG